MIAASAVPASPRPVKGSGALDCAIAIARARTDLRRALKWSSPGEARTRIEAKLELLDKASDLLLDPTGPRVERARVLLGCAADKP